MTTGGFGGEEIKQESSWRYTIGIFIAVLLLSLVLLYYYLGPSVDELGGNVPMPAVSEEPIALGVAGHVFEVPANYTVYPRDRRGGERENITLYALWPTLSGYAPARRDDFVGNEPDTRRIDIVIEKRTGAFREVERIENLYMPQTLDQRGTRTSYQLLKYEFREQRANVPTNGYSDTELFVGQTDAGAILAIFCFKERDEIRSPECWREYELNNEVSVIYRFKRPYLEEWRKIDAGVREFVQNMRTDKPAAL